MQLGSQYHPLNEGTMTTKIALNRFLIYLDIDIFWAITASMQLLPRKSMNTWYGGNILRYILGERVYLTLAGMQTSKLQDFSDNSTECVHTHSCCVFTDFQNVSIHIWLMSSTQRFSHITVCRFKPIKELFTRDIINLFKSWGFIPTFR